MACGNLLLRHNLDMRRGTAEPLHDQFFCPAVGLRDHRGVGFRLGSQPRARYASTSSAAAQASSVAKASSMSSSCAVIGAVYGFLGGPGKVAPRCYIRATP